LDPPVAWSDELCDGWLSVELTALLSVAAGWPASAVGDNVCSELELGSDKVGKREVELVLERWLERLLL